MKIKNMVKRVRKALAGFSLVEMLIVIAVIGVITAIAVPAISSITGEAEIAKVQRNVQNIASVYNSAIAAGADNGTPALETADKAAAVGQLQTGVTGSGAFGGAVFRISIADDERDAALDSLTLTDGVMTIINPAPITTP